MPLLLHISPSSFRSIEGELTSLSGVRSISVSLERKEGVAEFYPDSAAISALAISSKIFEMGFDAELKSAATGTASASRKVLNKCLFPSHLFSNVFLSVDYV